MNNPERIDIHDHSTKLHRELERLAADAVLLPGQRRDLLRFVSDARVGRLPRGKGGRAGSRRMSEGRCLKLIYTIRRFALAVPVEFEAVTVEQMQDFVLGIEDGRVRKLTRLGDSDTYTPDTVLDFKKILRRFYGWLLGPSSAKLTDLTGWFDLRETRPELKAITLDAVQRLARAIGTPQGQALVLGAFDGGFRAGELFNVRLKDVTFAPDAEGQSTCMVRIRVSKTLPRTISLPIATEAIKFWVERHPNGGEVRSDGSIAARDPEAPLLTWSYHYCRRVLLSSGRQELGERRLYIHRLRHASATWYARHLTPYQLCARYGWAMGSKAVQRYVDASGVLAQDTATIARRALSEHVGSFAQAAAVRRAGG
ncbi:MAG: site-specific integrase [Phycisphaerales bacterium]|nr:site-specific integrase [Phycisphaerales bacterium]